VTFFSNERGKYHAWSVRLDGSGRTRLSDTETGVTFTMFGPDGKSLVLGTLPTGGMIVTAPWPVKSGTQLPNLEVPGGGMSPTYWSRDGRWLSGYVVNQSGEAAGFAVYDLGTGRARQLNTDSRGFDMVWLPESRQVVYFTGQGALVLQDVVSLARRTIADSLPYPPDGMAGLAISPDGRTLYYGARQSEANIWLVRQQ
jgi:Tol biopolymer transport system component